MWALFRCEKLLIQGALLECVDFLQNAVENSSYSPLRFISVASHAEGDKYGLHSLTTVKY